VRPSKASMGPHMSFPRGGAGRVYAFALALVATVIFGGLASAQERHALVIGIDSYDNVASLAKARNDARAVAETLEETGFDTDLLIDVAGLDLLSELSRFSDQLDPGDEVVFYFAGHGVEIDGRNYLLPADVPGLGPGQELVIRRAALPVQEVIDQFNSRGVRLSLLILDACRDNPFETRGTRSLGGTRGLGQEVPPEGTFIMFSAGAGQAALDRLSEDDPNPNSVFTRVLLPRLSQPGLPLRTMVREVRSEVRQLGRTVGHEQFPAVYDQLDGAFTFLPGEGDDLGESRDAAVAAEPARDPCTAARADWAMVGENPSRFLLQAYRDTHSDCPLMAALATERLQQMETAAARDAASAQTAAAADAAAAEAARLQAQAQAERDREAAIQAQVQACIAVADPERMPWRDLLDSDMRQAEATCRGALQSGLNERSEGYALVQALLGRTLDAQGNSEEAFGYYLAAAEAGNSLAMNNLGVMYRNGRGVSQSDSEAVHWYRAGADAGNADAMANLGWMYRIGAGVDRSDQEGARWYRAAADSGNADAMFNLGWLYRTGRGVDQSDTEAVRWYQAGADAGSAGAMTNLAWLYRIGAGVEQSDTEALRWYREGAAAGNADAMAGLAFMIQEGRGTLGDYSGAADMFLAALANGGTWTLENSSALNRNVVVYMQRWLQLAGYYNGPIDGDAGPGTVRAMRAYQDAQGG